jgi:hypothetical protein
VSDTPNFKDLVGEGLPPGEQERLERVHEMLIAAGPPPELPPELEEPPDGRRNAVELYPTGFPRRRVGAALALAAAIALIAFVGGYIAGNSKSGPFESVRSVASSTTRRRRPSASGHATPTATRRCSSTSRA